MARKNSLAVRRWGRFIPFMYLLGILGYAVLSAFVPAFYNPNQQLRARAYEGDRVVFTSYFYWYKATGTIGPATHVVDVWTQDTLDMMATKTYPEGWPGPTNPLEMVVNKSGVLYHDALTHHPPAQPPTYFPNGTVNEASLVNGTMENITAWYDWMNPAWHRWELRCMMRAGIDVLMPIYWYNGLAGSEWAIDGLETLVTAWYQLAQNLTDEGQATSLREAYEMLPKICMFFDTTCMKILWSHETGGDFKYGAGPDLDDLHWQEAFWHSIEAFYDRVNTTELFTAPDGSNVIWLYGTEWFDDVGSGVLDYCKARFAEKYGRTCMFVGSKGWIKAGVDAVCPWGACCPGPVLPAERGIPVGEVGPGLYCLGATTMGSTGYVPRTDEKYRAHWNAVMDAGSVWVHVETWNELHEGTDIAWSQEEGFHWIDLTREMADVFHAMAGVVPPTNVDVVAFVVPLACLGMMIALGIATRARGTLAR